MLSEIPKNGINKGWIKKGSKLSKKIRKKISKSLLGNKRSLGYKHPEEFKKRLSEYNLKIGKHPPHYRGEKHYNWQGGKSPIKKRIRHSLEYKLWRESVFQRDNYTCVWCGARSGNGKKVILNADHIKPFAYYPELRFAIDNGRTLCTSCHRKTDTWGIKAKRKHGEAVGRVLKESLDKAFPL